MPLINKLSGLDLTWTEHGIWSPMMTLIGFQSSKEVSISKEDFEGDSKGQSVQGGLQRGLQTPLDLLSRFGLI